MAVDGITLQLLSDELSEGLTGCRIDKVFMPDKHTLIFHLRGYSGIKKLLVSILPSDPHINLTENTRDNPKMPPSFCMLLRKYISGSKILSITNPGYERLIEFKLQNTDELHDQRSFRLIVELMGRFANVILVNDNGKILDSAIHVDFQISRVREVMPARIYEYPQTQNKMLPEECLTLIDKGLPPILDEESGRPVTKALLNSVKGMSPVLCRGICINSDIDERSLYRDLPPDRQTRFLEECRKFFAMIADRDYKTYLYLDSNGDACEFSVLNHGGYPDVRTFGSVSECIEEYYNLKEKNINIDMRKQRMLQIINNAISKVVRKYDIHSADLEDAARCEIYKLYGDLILSYGHLCKPKADSVTCLNYYSDPQTEITIPLDPSLNANANAQDYYKKWHKAKRKKEISEEYLKEDELALRYLRTLKTAVDSSVSEEDIKAVEEEVRQEITSSNIRKADKNTNTGDPNKMVGRAKSGKASSRALRNAAKIAAARKNGQTYSKEKHKSEEALPFRRFTTSDGYEIICGRNNIQNDKLTFAIADKNDWWFHIKDLPGTHVILKAHKGEEFPSDNAVLEAAKAAAFYSRSAVFEDHAEKVTIDYCLVSHVKKLPKAKPGMVIYENYYSVTVKPE